MRWTTVGSPGAKMRSSGFTTTRNGTDKFLCTAWSKRATSGQKKTKKKQLLLTPIMPTNIKSTYRYRLRSINNSSQSWSMIHRQCARQLCRLLCRQLCRLCRQLRDTPRPVKWRGDTFYSFLLRTPWHQGNRATANLYFFLFLIYARYATAYCWEAKCAVLK